MLWEHVPQASVSITCDHALLVAKEGVIFFPSPALFPSSSQKNTPDRRLVFPQLFGLLQNFHECFY